MMAIRTLARSQESFGVVAIFIRAWMKIRGQWRAWRTLSLIPPGARISE
jgi:hypothetical protein